MRSVIQRCNWCRVLSEGKVCGEIGKGLVALLGIKRGDTEEDALYISDKICLLYTSPSPRDSTSSRMPSSA